MSVPLSSLSAQPAHLAFNRFVLGGYRAAPTTLRSALASVLSLHNETANIFSHLLPGVVAARWAAAALGGPLAGPAGGPAALVGLADAATAACLFCSVGYHTLMPATATRAAYDALLAVDVWGVWAVNVGAGAAVAYTLLPCAASGAAAALRAALVLAPAAAMFVALAACARTPRARALAFGLAWAARVGALVASAALRLAPWPPGRLLAHLAAEAAPALGAAANVARWPERLAPGRFDFAHSHTLFHAAVAAGLLAQHALARARAAETDAATARCAHEQWGAALAGAVAWARGWPA